MNETRNKDGVIHIKYLKFTFGAFSLAFVFFTILVSASQYGMANVSVPNLRGVKTVARADKDGLEHKLLI